MHDRQKHDDTSSLGKIENFFISDGYWISVILS